MNRRHCCELRLGHALKECECEANYCPNCSLCDAHCGCADEPVKVDGNEKSPADALPRRPGSSPPHAFLHEVSGLSLTDTSEAS